jgi:catechol 2,3-dioxygenase-like lactoylglutathione lyase family enzyme
VSTAPTLGRVVLLVHDQQDALAFYRDVLGFTVLHDEEADGLRYLHLGSAGLDGPGVWVLPAGSDEDRALVGRQAGGHPLLVLYADDLDALRDRLRAADVEVWAEREDAGTRSLHLRDAVGNILVAAQLPG